jgi:hypothetical protein
MRSKRYWVWAALLAGLWASPAVAQPHWITFHNGGGFNDAQAVKLTYWINDTCRPDEMGHIAGFSYQEAPGKPLNLQVYCRKGGTGKLGKIKVVRSAYPSEFLLEIPLPTERAVILGFDVTNIKGMGPPTGTVVMVVKQEVFDRQFLVH